MIVKMFIAWLGLALVFPSMAGAQSPTQAPAQAPAFGPIYQQALFANASYETKRHIHEIGAQYGYQVLTIQSLAKSNTRFFIAENAAKRSTIISVRGTVNMDNALLDLDTKMVENSLLEIQAHQGFTQATDEIYDAIVYNHTNKRDNKHNIKHNNKRNNKKRGLLKKDYRIMITGHSMGGAVAVLLAMYLDNEGYNIKQVTTFGQPKTIDRSAAKRFDHLPITRVVNELDIVPMLPPADLSGLLKLKLSMFWHLGEEIMLLQGPYYAEMNGLDSIMRGVELVKTKPDSDNLQAHTMADYLHKLKQKHRAAIKIPFEQRGSYLQKLQPEHAI